MSGFCPCGLAADSSAPRCRACPQRSQPPQAAAISARQGTLPAGVPVLLAHSRWRKSATTFGPAGRVIATVLLLTPLPVLLIAASLFIGLVGTGLYVLVIMPWALKDIWQRAAIPVEPPHAPTAPTGPTGFSLFEAPAAGWEDRRDAATSPDR